MKKQHSMIIIITIILLVVSSCSKNKEDIKTIKDFQTGTEGLSFEIFNVPEEIYDNSQTQPAVTVWNKGAYDLKDGRLMISTGKDDFCLFMGDNGCADALFEKLEIKGKSVFNPIGDFQIFEFGIKPKQLKKTEEERTEPVVFKTCYEYETELREDVCIDPSLGAMTSIEKACEVKDIDTSDQGSPVAIKKIETRFHKSTDEYVVPEFIITIRNDGNGEVIKKERTGDVCSSNKLNPKDWNTITLEEIRVMNDRFRYILGTGGKSMGGNNIKCIPNNQKGIRLKDNEVTLNCFVDPPGIHKNEGAFMTQIAIKLRYGYTYTETKKIKIVNPDVVR